MFVDLLVEKLLPCHLQQACPSCTSMDGHTLALRCDCRLPALHELRHYQIAQLEDIFLTEHHLNVVVDYANGGNLEEFKRLLARRGRPGLSYNDVRCRRLLASRESHLLPKQGHQGVATRWRVAQAQQLWLYRLLRLQGCHDACLACGLQTMPATVAGHAAQMCVSCMAAGGSSSSCS